MMESTLFSAKKKRIASRLNVVILFSVISLFNITIVYRYEIGYNPRIFDHRFVSPRNVSKPEAVNGGESSPGLIYRIPHPTISRTNVLADSSFSLSSKSRNKSDMKKSGVRVWCAVESGACKEAPSIHAAREKASKHSHDGILPSQPYSTSYTGEIGVKMRAPDKNGCEPASLWHDYVPTTCNYIHEIDIRYGATKGASLSSVSSADRNEDDDTALKMKLLGHGDMREAWSMSSRSLGVSSQTIVLKTVRSDRPFDHDMLTRQLKDALATERLSSSPYVVDMYGYCAMSVLNEFADGGDLHYHTETTNKGNTTAFEKLVIARDAALAVADIHEIDGPDRMTTFVHHDVRRPNFVMVGGKLKAHDFNQARMMGIHPESKKLCGFYWPNPCEKKKLWVYPRAPEECVHSGKKVSFPETVETYRLGSFLFNLLTGEHPYSTFEPEGPDRPLSEVVTWVVDTNRIPQFSKQIRKSHDPSTKALAKGVRMAMTQDLTKRPRTRVVANYFATAVELILKPDGSVS